jgi:beta-phosphoglucomutase-like phosphatase (HAD superfamily)
VIFDNDSVIVDTMDTFLESYVEMVGHEIPIEFQKQIEGKTLQESNEL